ncbi:substrate-binding domain-containing protein [Roseomonas sp. F4]
MHRPLALGRRGLLALLPLLPGRAWTEAPTSLRIGGTGMALTITRHLIERHRGAEEVTGVEVLESLGTQGGLAALLDGRIDIALSARALRPAEQAAGLSALHFARTPIAFATRHDTPVAGLSLAQIVAMLAGEMPGWPGGGKVRVVLRDASETDWVLVAGSAPAMAAAMAQAQARPGLALAGTDQENAELLEQLPGSLGLITLGQTRVEHRQLRLLTLDGVAPGLVAMDGGTARFARDVFAVTREGIGPDIRGFLDFLTEPLAHETLSSFGFQPMARRRT